MSLTNKTGYSMQTIFNSVRSLLPFALATVLASGCATPALWNHTAKHEWKAGPPDQALLISRTNDQKDLVILFRQKANDWSPMIGVKTNITRHAAWIIGQSPDRVAETPKAISEFNGLASNYRDVPIYNQSDVPTNASPRGQGYVVWNSTNTQLTVHIVGQPTGPFTLPSTVQKQKTAQRVAGAPVAVAGDAAMVGTVVFCGGFCLIYYSPAIAYVGLAALADYGSGIAKGNHPNTASLYIFLENNQPDATLWFQIYLDDKVINTATNRPVTLTNLYPGIHKIAVTSSGQSVMSNISMKTGKNYFVQIELRGTSGTVTPTIKQLSKSEGFKRMNKPAIKLGQKQDKL